MKITAREMVLVSFCTALCVIAAIFSKYGGEAAVPFSLLPLIVMISAGILGGKLASLSIIIYILLGIIGIPVFAKPPYAGLTYFLMPSAGFLFGFVLGAYIIGKTVDYLGNDNVYKLIGANVIGLIAIYLVGLPYLYLVLKYYMGTVISVGQVIKIGFLPFIVVDLIKVVIAAVLTFKINARIR